MSAWTEEGEKLALSLEGLKDESKIKALCEEVVRKINDRYSNPASRKNPLAAVRKAIVTKYPATSTQKASYQYPTDSGKGKKPRWEHLALKYLSLSERDWDDLGGDDRAEWKAMQQEEPLPETTKKPLETMTIEDLELDAETQAIVKDALARSEMSLADFLKQSLRVYAKTITGKARQLGEDLANVPTEKLLKDAAYSTHPGRAEELVKRAIRAIKTYNDEVATEPKQRWVITPSLLNQLTGSRAAKINEILATCKDEIDSHHAKYPDFFEENGTLKQYFNRKRGVDAEDEINLIERVPLGF